MHDFACIMDFAAVDIMTLNETFGKKVRIPFATEVKIFFHPPPLLSSTARNLLASQFHCEYIYGQKFMVDHSNSDKMRLETAMSSWKHGSISSLGSFINYIDRFFGLWLGLPSV